MDKKIEQSLRISRWEWAFEQIEDAYKRREIGKITFHRRMSALGFKTEGIKKHLAELDAERRS